MKILFKEEIKVIDTITHAFFDFINKLPDDSELNQFIKLNRINSINQIRKILGLPRIITFSAQIQMPKVKPPKKEECEHCFEVTYADAKITTLFCKKCGEFRHNNLF